MRRYRTLDEWIAEARAGRTDDECWPWPGARNEWNYGRIRVARVEWRAHRLVWTERVGAIPEGLELGHVCHDRAFAALECPGGSVCEHRACINYLSHLEPQTRLQNARGHRRTTCRKCSHPYDRVRRTQRDGEVPYCGPCNREWQRVNRASR